MLGPLTNELIQKTCPTSHQQAVGNLLSDQCSVSLPGVGIPPEWIDVIDRVQLATIRGSSWNIEKLKSNVSLANSDWRDVLMAAGFGENLTAHTLWQKAAVQSHDVS
jgi:hypothetical protein